MKSYWEIRWHARGGQGAWTASQFLASAALSVNKYFQSFPEFGAEREGAPIVAYTKISDMPIKNYSQIEEPDAVVVLDPTLFSQVNFLNGLKSDGYLIVNYPGDPKQLREELKIPPGIKVFTVDATKIALETLKRPITNTTMAGALVKATGILNFEDVVNEMIRSFSGKFKQEIIDANVNAIRRAYEEVKQG
ncbi:pyruvate/ketoisovalerate oxidoreductase, gamma subunit [Thermodesulfobium narugense DSM 14796]|uniref:Pyruvate/ketoisovalerate oxidoreductase, gamma subunit n=1 Tax=Thermodesulfobium narugense DSM 14796 TaxID=747365 RepID=M1E4G4_9BACT|nr:2-oxoacid:acceptor oxidoreductase family protein [Thermodesulfobium narugense]AEE14132.1 pyruvate/ketoisovalerate oxidoreductase, gamma subunit [Thermodesulfobium narugense DSM 14796]